MPDLRGRFLQGNDIGNTVIEAALPNIKGLIHGLPIHRDHYYTSGAIWIRPTKPYNFYMPSDDNWFSDVSDLQLNASLSNPIYSDMCNTVQPPAVTVRYYIRAK